MPEGVSERSGNAGFERGGCRPRPPSSQRPQQRSPHHRSTRPPELRRSSPGLRERAQASKGYGAARRSVGAVATPKRYHAGHGNGGITVAG